MRAYKTDKNPRRPIQARSARRREPCSCSTASWASQRASANAMTAPSVAETIEIGVPSQVPKSRPEAPASSGPGNSAGVSAAETAMKISGPATP
jgi:hypothetical protein